MNDATLFQTGMHTNLRSRSMGLKLMVVCALALVMTIPSFFVGGLVDDRSHGRRTPLSKRTTNQPVSKRFLVFQSRWWTPIDRSIDR
jgi:hypothetical protein